MEDEQNKPIRRIAIARLKEEIPTPPPPGFTSPFRSIEEWLTRICDTNQPQKAISEYRFLVFGISGEYLLGLAGYNTYREEDCEIRQIDFSPSITFFALPRDVYGHLSTMEAREYARDELIKFTKTATFQESFLSKGIITTDLFGEIWPNYYPEE